MRFPKNFKQILLTGAFILCSLLTFAQGVYVKIGGGYNFGIGSHYGTNTTITSTFNPDDNTTQFKEVSERVKVNFGKGLTGNGAFGFMFSEQLGAELEVSYLAGGKNETSYQSQFNPNPDKSLLIRSKMYARMLLLQPSLVMAFTLTDKINLYGKFGIVAAKGKIFMNSYYFNERQESIKEAQYDGGWGFGLMGGIGFSYKLNEKLALFSEIKMNNLSYSPKWYRLKKEILNGEDITATQQQNVELVNSYSITTYSDQSSVNIKEPFVFGSVGLNVGLKYNF